MSPDRVHIIGGAGSGKSTLAREYSRKHGMPHYDLDHFMWAQVAARIPRPEIERDRLLRQSIDAARWVIEGIFWQDWVIPSLERAEKIIVLDVPESARHYRVVVRHFKLLLKASPSDYHLFFPTLFELVRLNRSYRAEPYKRTIQALSPFRERVIICSSNEDAARELNL